MDKIRVMSMVPLTYGNIIVRSIDRDSQDAVDIGCGRGELLMLIDNRRRWSVIGVDGFLPYLRLAAETGAYWGLVLCDAKFLPFRSKCIDLALCLEVLEHLPRTEGLHLLDELERLARKQIVLSTPVGFLPRPLACHGKVNENPLELHKSGWHSRDFTIRGYKTRGQGVGIVYREGGIAYKMRRLVWLFVAVSYLLAPLVYFLPSAAAHVIATKRTVRAS